MEVNISSLVLGRGKNAGAGINPLGVNSCRDIYYYITLRNLQNREFYRGFHHIREEGGAGEHEINETYSPDQVHATNYFRNFMKQAFYFPFYSLETAAQGSQ